MLKLLAMTSRGVACHCESLRRGAAEVRKQPRPLVLGGLAKASGLDDGSIICRGAIVKGKALGDATRPASFLRARLAERGKGP